MVVVRLGYGFAWVSFQMVVGSPGVPKVDGQVTQFGGIGHHPNLLRKGFEGAQRPSKSQLYSTSKKVLGAWHADGLSTSSFLVA